MSQGGKLTPNIDQQSTKLLNLTVLQRIDPCIEEILLTATHVTFYKFNIELNQWSRKDVEGSLFVVKRNGQPRFQFIVMNRRSTENVVENLLEDFEFEVQVPYLLYRNAAQEVNGIWFNNSRECEDVANFFSRFSVHLLNESSSVVIEQRKRKFQNNENLDNPLQKHKSINYKHEFESMFERDTIEKTRCLEEGVRPTINPPESSTVLDGATPAYGFVHHFESHGLVDSLPSGFDHLLGFEDFSFNGSLPLSELHCSFPGMEGSGTRNSTIDVEFEEYFSALML